MYYQIVKKSIDPFLTLTWEEEFRLGELGQSAEKIYVTAGEFSHGVVVVQLLAPDQGDESPVKLSFPLKKADFLTHYPSEHFVMPRVTAVTTTLRGSHHLLSDVLEVLHKTIKEQGETPQLPYRIRYERVDTRFFKGRDKNYITEVIVPLVENA